MMLGASQVQRIWRPQAKASSQLRCLQIDWFWHGQRYEAIEQFGKGSLQNRITAFDGTHEAFAFDERRNPEPVVGRRNCGSNDSAPTRMRLDEVDHEASIEINHSQEVLSSSIAASISSAERRA